MDGSTDTKTVITNKPHARSVSGGGNVACRSCQTGGRWEHQRTEANGGIDERVEAESEKEDNVGRQFKTVLGAAKRKANTTASLVDF